MNPIEKLILNQLAVCVPAEIYGIDLVNRSGGNLKMGSVYLHLGRLEDDGYVSSRRVEDPAQPVPRRLYQITDAGRSVLNKLAGAPRVHNRHHKTAPPGSVYVGRGTPWGNPFRVGVDGDRATCIRRFEMETLPGLDVTALRGKHLECSCNPKACHADSLLRKANG